MRIAMAIVLLVGFSGAALAQGPPADKALSDAPISSLPYTPGLNIEFMDTSADPCVDFYQYSCGGWMKKNPIPADQPGWSVYAKLAQDNERFLWGILSDLASKSQGRNANQQKIGDYFAACMDESAVEKLGAAPIKPYLEQINRLESKKQLPAVLAQIHLRSDSSDMFFGFGSGQEYGDSSQVIAFANSGGLGLPDRDYYTRSDAHSVELRQKYVAHVQRMFVLLGDAPDAAQREAVRVMAIESALAQATLTRVQRRDPHNLDHKMDLAQLQALSPSFDWKVYLKELGLGQQNVFNVTQPAFYKELEKPASGCEHR